MNRYALCDHILRMKDQGAKEIVIHLNGKTYKVPTKYSGEGTTSLCTIMNPDDEGAVQTEIRI